MNKRGELRQRLMQGDVILCRAEAPTEVFGDQICISSEYGGIWRCGVHEKSKDLAQEVRQRAGGSKCGFPHSSLPVSFPRSPGGGGGRENVRSPSRSLAGMPKAYLC